MTTEVDICNRALQMCAARSTITSLSDGSNEANNCQLLYTSIRNQILSMAQWNFARRTINMNLVKAAPGTPQSPVVTSLQWIPAYPAPPWMYEYQYPADCMQFRYLMTSPQSAVIANGVALFSTPQYTFDPLLMSSPQRFAVATDIVGPTKEITGITKASPAVVTSVAHGFSNGQTVYITSVIGMTQINNQLYTIANVTADTFELSGSNSSQYDTYVTGGVAVNQSAAATRNNVILSNAAGAVGTYTMLVDDLNLWPDQAIQAFISALSGFLAIPLSGDRHLADQLIQIANTHILSARSTDGNEGFTVQESMPDWIRARADIYPFTGDWGLGMLVSPYPPLFAIS